jgi:hypothetical protein
METKKTMQIQPTRTLSLADFVPKALTSTCKDIHTVEDIIKAKFPSLRRLANENNCDTVKDMLRLQFKQFDAYMNAKSGLTEEAIELLTDEIFTMYGHILSFADINLIFRNAKLGRYGELYNQLSSMKIMQWFDKYVDEKLNTAEKLSQDKDNERMMLGAPRSSATVTIEDGGFLNYKLHLANNNYKLQEQ